jgi:hypothetical protein
MRRGGGKRGEGKRGKGKRGKEKKKKKHHTYTAPHRCDVEEAICKAMKAAAMFTVTLIAKRAMCTSHRMEGYGLIRIRSKRL